MAIKAINYQGRLERFMHADALDGSMNDVYINAVGQPHQTRTWDEDAYRSEVRDNKTHRSCIGQASRTEAADNVQLVGSWEFCNACSSAIGYLAQHLKEAEANRKDQDWLGKSQSSAVHHWNTVALIEASDAGCQLCRLIVDRCTIRLLESCSTLAKAGDEPFTEFFFNTTHQETWHASQSHNQTPGEFRLIVAVRGLSGRGPEKALGKCINVMRLQLWPSPHFDEVFKHIGETARPDTTVSGQSSAALAVPVNTRRLSNTQSCRPLAAQWLADCKRNVDGKHTSCSDGKPQWLPTRLVDLRQLKTTGRLLLLTTASLRNGGEDQADYITLSHCWGAWGAANLPTLKQANIQQRQAHGLDWENLPKTFQDALSFIWIDSLCIIQDFEEDWQREALLMCEVYKHALLNISADDSVDARGGCFRDRDPAVVEPFQIHLRNLESSYWATLDERTLFDWVGQSPISKRAWVYQERNLSKRVLHFTRYEVFWECCAAAPSFRSETFPLGSPLTRDFVGQTKLDPVELSGGQLENNEHSRYIWDKGCQDFSNLYLTYANDRLPAIAGLAKEIGSACPSDTYLAGHWLSSLPRTLLWFVSRKDVDQTSARSDRYPVPTWSWLCSSSRVTIRDFCNCHSIINIRNFEYHTTGSDRYGRLEKSLLTVDVLMRKITCVDEPPPFTEEDGYVYNMTMHLGVNVYQKLYVDSRLGEPVGERHLNSGQYGIHMDHTGSSTEAQEHYCLLVAVTKIPDPSFRVLWGLLLERAEDTNTYKRVGTVSFTGECALRVRYKVKDCAQDVEKAWQQLWREAKPRWGNPGIDGRVKYGEPAKDAVVSREGPLSLYDFDAEADSNLFEELALETVILT